MANRKWLCQWLSFADHNIKYYGIEVIYGWEGNMTNLMGGGEVWEGKAY